MLQTNLGLKLIAVMDVNILKLFTAQGIKITGNIGSFDITSGNDHKREKFEGFNQKMSAPGSLFEPHTTQKDIDLKDSSRNASHHIEEVFAHHPECKEVIIVSDPKMLGHLRQTLSDKVKKVISKEINKDLTHHTTDSIEKVVFA